MNTMPTSPATPDRKRNRLVIGAAAAVIAGALVAGAGYWWLDRDELSQASAADCRLAQRIITGDERRAQMEDGYLGARISQYEGWALATAQKSPEAPSAKDVRNLEKEARGHCSDSGVTLSMPPFGA
ncbi:hypothetical protein ACWC4E_15065 [Streptomyces sp. NPDC001273]|uniref:hypothetical protein n=1 Tax=unclassified Streptomyces TaxID=2593676 RepID=UPI00340E9049